MAENWDEPAAPAQEAVLPAVTAEYAEVKLFGKWSCDEVQVSDISLTDYIAVKEKYAKYLPHSSGRYQIKRFRKAQCPVVERLANSMMMHGRNNGKKLMTMRIVQHAFEIIHLLTGEGSSNSYAIKKKDELERVAKSNR
ncbi:40S ribosomal protein S5 [Holothuria leucospilota]|uniref:40S ribosomal protein S5 n=1 Tax=Holothuria leucospilota TaxID=206669 RepID=A0A9Q1C7J5_HOLLE|nr:40S ribosomal protein S5 [Holothuria leucospilota]